MHLHAFYATSCSLGLHSYTLQRVFCEELCFCPINLYAPRFFYIGTGVSLLSRERFLYI